MTSPQPWQTEVVVKTDVMVRRVRTFKVAILGMHKFLLALHHQNFTGKVTVNMSQGGMQSVQVEDTRPISPDTLDTPGEGV